MDLIRIMETFPTQEHCIEYLEHLRWQGSPECPHCESTHIRRRNEHDIGRIGRYNCHDCRSTFKATHGTIFQGTKIPLQKWFLGDRVDGECEEKPLKLPTFTRFRIATENMLAYNDGYPCRDG